LGIFLNEVGAAPCIGDSRTCGLRIISPRPNPSVVEREIIGNVLSELCRAVINIQGLANQKDPDPAAVLNHFDPQDGWLALIETSLRTDLEGNASPSTTLLGPIIPNALVPKGGTTGSYNIGVGGSFDQTNTTLRDDKRYVVLATLMHDPALCPQVGSEEYLAYANGAEYQGYGKYLAGTLGIREWLRLGIESQDFAPIASPTTEILEAPPQENQINRLTSTMHEFISSQKLTQAAAPCKGIKVTPNVLPNWDLTQGQQFSGYQEPNPFKPCTTETLSYKVDQSWLNVSAGANDEVLIFGTNTPIPNTALNSTKVTVTATGNTSNRRALRAFAALI
jgi:hypothetical protein